MASGVGVQAEGGPEGGTAVPVTLLFFAAAREAAGTGREAVVGATLDQVLAQAALRHGAAFGEVLAHSRVWVNGEPAPAGAPLAAGDEVAVLPPVSGGA